MRALRRYRDAEPAERGGADADQLVTYPSTDATSQSGTGTRNIPYAGTPARNSQQYHRRPFGLGMATAPQLVGMGAEAKQSGAGRAFIPPTLALPVQSPTPEPDHRRIARALPSTPRDHGQVIGSSPGRLAPDA